MEVRVFTLCDGVYNYNGKLTIVGTSDNLKVQTIPTIAGIGLALKIAFSSQELGKKDIEISFTNLSTGLQVLPPLKFQPVIESKGEEGSLVVAANINGLDIQTLGKYKVDLNIDGNLFSLPFKVIK